MNFQTDVLELSHTRPVVVDFWAPWCGPCRVLGPVLEQLAEEHATEWTLVKVNTEEHQDIAYEYGIRSIPAVKLFYRGEVVDEFVGALPRQKIVEWLDQVLPNEGLMALDRILNEGDEPDPVKVEKLFEQYPDQQAIRLVLAQTVLWNDPIRAVQLVEPIRMGTPFYDKAVEIRDIVSFLTSETEDPQLVEIKDLLSKKALEQALKQTIDVLGKNNKILEGKLAKAAIGIFNFLGPRHDLTKKYRRLLDMVLWV